MRHEYKKPVIEVKNWFVSSSHIKRLYSFFKHRFPGSEIEITLETESGHTRTYETLNEYIEDLPKLSADAEVVSKIIISERENSGRHNYKQAWIDISFGKRNPARVNIIGGDTDESNKDWVEGTYTEALKLKSIFEVSDLSALNHLGKDGGGVVFDPDGNKFETLSNQAQSKSDKPQKVEVVNNKIHWHQTWWGFLILGIILAGIVFYIGWN